MEVSYHNRFNYFVINYIYFRPYTYKDCLPGANTQEFSLKVAQLKRELSKLSEYEHELDLHRLWIEQSIRNTTEDLETKKYLYVTNEDFSSCYEDSDTVIVVNTPINNTNVKYQVNYSIIVTSYC